MKLFSLLRGTAARIALLAIFGLVAAQLLSVAVALLLRPTEVRVFSIPWLADHVSQIARETFTRPAAQRASYLRNRPEPHNLQFELTPLWAPADEIRRRGVGRLQRALNERLPEGFQAVVEFHGHYRGRWGFASEGQVTRIPPVAGTPESTLDAFVPAGFFMAIRGPDQTWLLVSARQWEAWWGVNVLLAWLAGITVAGVLIAWWAARRIARPLEALAREATRAGAGLQPDFTPATGAPHEVGAIAIALDEMRGRLTRFLDDRTRMLAAVSHDLRTPLTRLRLRAEGIADREEQAKALSDIAEMEHMIAETLAFARADALDTPAQRFDVAALTQSLVDERTDMGAAATYDGPQSLVIEGRAGALKRAIANLLDNAIAYGGRAEVTLAAEPGALALSIRDEGPGIPPAELEAVFRPFYRLETSRSRDTGGSGLGLALARDIARGHGGDVVLANRDPHGLEARLALPMVA
ncbi:MAG: HAMP domain-containing protein [Alphaproteobacteria bacterium]|nr:HAMP domain-containing protein [Alphaproteobacteria bacterium]